MIYRDSQIAILSPYALTVVCINDVLDNDDRLYTLVAVSIEYIETLQRVYQNPYYRFLTVAEYMSLTYMARL